MTCSYSPKSVSLTCSAPRIQSVRPTKPPYTTQPATITTANSTDAITVTAGVFATTGTTSATLAQVTADPTINLTGTGFTTKTYGHTCMGSSLPLIRVTTYTSAVAIAFECEAVDLKTGSLWVGAIKINHGTQASSPIQMTVT